VPVSQPTPSKKPLWPLRVTLLLVGSAGLLILMSVLAASSVAVLSDRAEWVTHTERVRFELSRVLQLTIDVETAGRGYALTSDVRFLEPYRDAAPSLKSAQAILQQLVIDNPRQKLSAERLQSLVRQQVGWTERNINAVRTGRAEEARLRIVAGEGKTLMDAVRQAAAGMMAEEDRLLEVRRAEGAQARHNAMLAMGTSGALAVFMLCFVVWMTLHDRAQVQRAEAELVITLRSIGDAVISTDAAGTIRFMNTIAEQLTGWSASEARGRPLDAVFRVLDEETRATVESPVAKVLRDGVVVGLANHTVLLARGGGETVIENSGAPIRDGNADLSGVVLVFRDASIRRLAERKLQESEERFRAAVDAVQGVLWTNTPEGELRGEQPGWAKLTGQRFEEYQGFGWANVVHPEDAKATIDAWLEAVRERRLFIFEHRVRRHDHQWRNFSVRAIPLFDSNEAIRQWVGVHTDITEQRQAELALREAGIRKDVFLATLSHELRNPLAPIRTSARLLESGKLGPQEAARSHAIISRQVRHMATLLDDLLDVSRITRGMLTLKREPAFLRSILEGAVEAARPSIDAKRHALLVQCPQENIELDADPVRLTQVATNLLTNAAKYTDPEGHIIFGAQLEADALRLYVRDTGIGIAADKLIEVFEMFAQVHADAERSEGGLGIGLALVKGLVELHGGRVQVRSAGLERGSEFLVFLPRAIVKVLSDTTAESTGAAAAVSKPRRILLADDSQDGAASLGMLLESFGHEVYLAHNGADALVLCEKHRPQVCVLDIGMPGLNGYEVAQGIRREAWGKPVILIAVTGYGQEDDKAKAQAAGFDHHLTKPVDPDALESIIHVD
jgi:PAS domain S-box-containing protein